jgi:eukaryotic-like serine/threonine-protein kinase
MPLTAGEKLGHYEVLSLLGQGGMGEVYRARDTKLKRDVAIKVLPETVARDRERLARFQREAEVLASLNHPNIAHIYGVEDRALVMELVEGDSPKGPMPFEETWKICSQIAEALDYAHDKGVVYRDLKPANVKVTPEGLVKPLDFGLAKAFSETPDSAPSDPANSPTVTRRSHAPLRSIPRFHRVARASRNRERRPSVLVSAHILSTRHRGPITAGLFLAGGAFFSRVSSQRHKKVDYS